MTTVPLVGVAASGAACGDRLDLVDAAFDRGNSHAVAELRDHYCLTCPIEQACFTAGMAEPQMVRSGGVWGGVSANQRTRATNRRTGKTRHRTEKT